MAQQTLKRSTQAPVLPEHFKSRPPGAKLVSPDKLVVPAPKPAPPAPPKANQPK